MKHVKKIRNIYQQRTKIQLQCRVCLTSSNNIMFNLDDETISLEENLSNCPEEMSVREALEKVTSTKVIMEKDYPQCICPVCLSFLKISLKFILQFEESQKKLNRLGPSIFNKDCKDEQCKNSTKYNTVEIIFGQNKYSLSDLIVVEDDEKEQCNFNGFLKNLGKEVSATFIDKTKDLKTEKGMSSNEVTIAVIENDKLLTVKEICLNEETDEIEYFVDDVDIKSTKEIVEIQYEENKPNVEIHEPFSFNENFEFVDMDENNIESFIIETGKSLENKYKENIGLNIQRKIRVRKRNKFQDNSARCNLCKKIYITFKALKAHQKRVHFGEVKEREYMCEICGYKNNTLSGHKHHMNKHSGKKWACDICHKHYYTKAVLKVHMESHRNRRQFLCSVCGKGFNYSNALVYHMRLHTGEKNYECHICHQKYRMPNGLQRHLRTHTGEKPYKCKFCTKPFYSRSESTAHELTHTDYRPYHCVYCNKGFIKSHNMKVHWLGHSGSHKCTICTKTFADSDILSFHYRFSHKISKRKAEYEASDTEEQENESEDFFESV